MDRDVQLSLIYKSLKGDISDQEQQQLDNWLEEDAANQQLRDQVQQEWELSEAYEPNLRIDTKADFQKLKARIEEYDKAEKKASDEGRVVPLRRRWLSIAAGLLLAFSLAWWLWPNTPDPVQYSEITTGEGEKRELLLADGSTVWLNENSKLIFPDRFVDDQRLIKLEGEAFFSVQKNTDSPFIIQTVHEAEIQVLGTSFLVQATSGSEQVLVEVATGTVRLQNNAKEQQLVLTAGERGIWSTADNSAQKSEAGNQNIYAWQSGVLRFEQTPMPQVIADVERYFQVSITAENPNILDCIVSARFPDPELEEVLTAITFTLDLEWSRNDQGQYSITGDGCQ